MFIGLLRFSEFLANKCLLLNNECKARATLIDLNLFMISLDQCNGSCNTLCEISDRTVLLNKMEDVNLNVLKMITRKNESKTLTKDISCECECKFDGRNCNSNQKWNKNKY